MNHDSELTAAIRKQVENLGDLIDDTVPYVFEYVDFHMMIECLIMRDFKKDGFKPIDLDLLPPSMLVDNDGIPIAPNQFFQSYDYLDTPKRFNCAMAVFYWREINKLIKKGDYVSAMPMLVTAFGLIGFAIENHATDVETSAAMASKQTQSKKKSLERIEHYRQWTLDNRHKYPTNDAASYEIQKMVLKLENIEFSRRQIKDFWLKGLK